MKLDAWPKSHSSLHVLTEELFERVGCKTDVNRIRSQDVEHLFMRRQRLFKAFKPDLILGEGFGSGSLQQAP